LQVAATLKEGLGNLEIQTIGDVRIEDIEGTVVGGAHGIEIDAHRGTRAQHLTICSLGGLRKAIQGVGSADLVRLRLRDPDGVERKRKLGVEGGFGGGDGIRGIVNVKLGDTDIGGVLEEEFEKALNGENELVTGDVRFETFDIALLDDIGMKAVALLAGYRKSIGRVA